LEEEQLCESIRLKRERKEQSFIQEVRHLNFVSGDLKFALAKDQTRQKYLHPVYMEELSLNTNQRSLEGLQIFFLVHGFLGEAADMWMIKNELLRISRNFKIIRSDANEDRTHSSIWDLGAELAEEVQKYLLRYEGEDI